MQVLRLLLLQLGQAQVQAQVQAPLLSRPRSLVLLQVDPQEAQGLALVGPRVLGQVWFLVPEQVPTLQGLRTEEALCLVPS